MFSVGVAGGGCERDVRVLSMCGWGVEIALMVMMMLLACVSCLGGWRLAHVLCV